MRPLARAGLAHTLNLMYELATGGLALGLGMIGHGFMLLDYWPGEVLFFGLVGLIWISILIYCVKYWNHDSSI